MAAFDKSRRRSLGFTLMEMFIALAVSALAGAMVLQQVYDATDQVRNRAVADRMKEIVQATENYVRTYYSQLATQTAGGAMVTVPVGRTTAAGAVPVGPGGLPSIQGGGFLSSSFIDSTPYAHWHSVLVRQPVANQLEVLIVSRGGRIIENKNLGTIASAVGSGGGFVLNDPATIGQPVNTVQGTFGGWRTGTATWGSVPQAGHLAVALGMNSGTAIADYLYRYDIGVPEANRMHTDVDVNSNNLNNIANTDTQTIDNSRGASVDINDNATVNGSATVNGNLTVNGTGLFTGRITGNNGVRITADWYRLDGNGGVSWETWGGQLWMQDATWLRTDVSLYTPGTMRADTEMRTPRLLDHNDANYLLDPNQSSRLNSLQTDILNVDTAISGARAGGTAYRLGDLLPRFVGQSNWWVDNGDLVGKPTCGTGGTPKIVLILHRIGFGACTSSTWCGSAGGAVNIRATDAGASWRVDIDRINNQIAPQALAQTYCYYP